MNLLEYLELLRVDEPQSSSCEASALRANQRPLLTRARRVEVARPRETTYAVLAYDVWYEGVVALCLDAAAARTLAEVVTYAVPIRPRFAANVDCSVATAERAVEVDHVLWLLSSRLDSLAYPGVVETKNSRGVRPLVP